MKTILAIDDKKDNLITLKAVIKSNSPNYEVLTALSGYEGIKLAIEKQPDVILLDIIMPEMDGFETCKRLKENEQTKHIPVVMITAIKTDAKSRVKGLEIGADAFLSKPIDAVELMAQINVMLRIKEAEDKLRFEKEDLEKIVKDRTSELTGKNKSLQFEIKKRIKAEQALRDIATEFSAVSGLEFFEKVCMYLTKTLKVDFAFVGELLPNKSTVLVKAGIGKGMPLEQFKYDLADTPCENVIDKDVCAYQSDIQKLFPKDQLLIDMGIESYIGIPLFDRAGQALGIMVLLDTKELIDPEIPTSVLQIFSNRVATEMERMQAKDKLEESENRYRILAENSTDTIWLMKLDGTFLYHSPAVMQLRGHTPEEANNLSMKETMTPQSMKFLDKIFVRENAKPMKERWNALRFELEMFRKDGSKIWTEVSAKAVFDDNNQMIGLQGSTHDISERKHVEDKIRKLSTAVEQSPSVIAITNLDGKFEYVNPRFTELTGYTSKEVLGEKTSLLKSGEQGGEFYKELWKKISVGKKWRGEFHNKKKNGKFFWEAASISPIFNEEGKITNYLKVAEDITERKLVEEKLKESEERFRQITENSQEWVWEVDEKGMYTYASPVMESLLGYKPEEIVGKKYFYDLFLPEERLELKKAALEVFKQKQPFYEFENRNLSKDRKIVWLSTSGVPKLDDKGKLIGYRGADINITERKLAEDALAVQSKRLSDILEGTNAGTWDWNIQTGELILNERWAEIMGYTLEELEPIDVSVWEDNTHPEDLVIATDLLNKHFNKETEYYDVEFRQPHKNGKWIWVNAHGKVIEWTKNGKPLRMSGTHLDITERKLAEDALRSSEERLKIIFESAPDAIYLSNLKGDFLDGNVAAEDLLGFKKDDLIGKSFLKLKLLSTKGLLKAAKTLGKSVMGKKTGPDEFLLNRKDGTQVSVEISTYPVKIKNKTVILGIARDITERKRAEQIQKVLYNISNAVISTNDLTELFVIIKKELGMVIDTTNFYVAIYDQKTETISLPFMVDEKDSFEYFPAGKTLTNYVIKTKKSLLATSDKFSELVELGEVHSFGTDSKIWLGTPLEIEGKVIGVIAVQSYTDENAYTEADKEILEFIADQISISIDRKTAEELLIKSEERFDLAMNASNDGLFDLNLVTNEVYYSARWKGILGYTDDELPNDFSVWESLSHKDDKETSLFELEKATEQKIEHYEVEFRMKHKLGHWVNILSRAQIIYNKEGKAIRAVGTHSDLTEQKKAEQDLLDALKKAEESDRLKSAFLANMSHEIRTPMNGILGFANLLKEPDLSREEQEEYVQIINRSGNRMLNIINDLVDISKIEAGQMKVSLSKFNINEQIEFLFDFFTPEANSNGLKLSFRNSLPMDQAIIESDKEKFIAILTNLIKNAIKYTIEGSIEFGYQIKSKDDSEELEFFVKDTGMGIPQDRQNAIFERFIQADIEDTQAFEGAGLGLSIAQAYVEMLGGKISVESIEGEGSQFYFTIPYRTKSKEESIQKDTSKEDFALNTNKLTILIVEDDYSSEFYLETLIKGICKGVLFARTGKEAVILSQKNPDIDFILMDIKMPEMDGFEAIKQIREFNKKVVIIAQTAYALAGDREKLLEAGCNDYISKPIKKDVLMKMLSKHLSEINK